MFTDFSYLCRVNYQRKNNSVFMGLKNELKKQLELATNSKRPPSATLSSNIHNAFFRFSVNSEPTISLLGKINLSVLSSNYSAIRL